ncbi:MAG TPA: hypothetical protein VNG71_04480 [Pyrinomonadaceae bacterium]|nr:hypothetical protein [Pyrinomonadaceae bacterium]
MSTESEQMSAAEIAEQIVNNWRAYFALELGPVQRGTLRNCISAELESERSRARADVDALRKQIDQLLGEPEAVHAGAQAAITALRQAQVVTEERDAAVEALKLVQDCAFLDSRCTEEQWNEACEAVDAVLMNADRRVAEVLEDYSKRPTREEYDKLRADVAELRSKLDQVDDVLMSDHIVAVNGEYRKALSELVSFEIRIHDDPAVSGIAAKRKADVAELVESLQLIPFEIMEHVGPPYTVNFSTAVFQQLRKAFAKHSEAGKV